MQIQTTKQIQAPVAIVFDVFSDIENIDSRIKGITQVEILSDVRQGVGTRWRETRVMFGQEATEEMAISKFDVNRSYEVVASSRGMDYHSVYTFQEQDGGTLVTMTFAGKAISLTAKLMAPLGYLMQGPTRKALEADMDDLKAICEQRVTQPAA